MIANILVAGILLWFSTAGICFAQGKVYKWTDSDGTVHFSDRLETVPPQFRNKIEERELEPTDVSREEKPSPPKALPPTDIRGRDKAWWLSQKKHWAGEVVRLKKHISKNQADMAQLARGRVRFAERTDEGINLNKGSRIYDYRELKRLREITSALEEELKKVEYMCKEGLIRNAYRAGVPPEWIADLKKAEIESSPVEEQRP